LKLSILANIVVATNLVLDLILVLQNQPNVRILPSPSGRANLLEDLCTVGSSVYSIEFDIKSAISLMMGTASTSSLEM